MSIASKLTKLETDITNAYSAIQTKGGTIPSNKNTENLSTAINSISGGGDYNIKVDTSNNISGNFYGLQAYIVEIGNIDTSNIIDMTNMFGGSQITEFPLLNTQNVTNMYGMFYGCSALTTVPLLNTQNVTDMANMFAGSPELTNESLNNVLKMCIDAVNIASSYKTLYYIGLSQAQVTTCKTLSNYQDFLSAGWTTGD